MATSKPVRLLCCCCGAETLGRQWWNRDIGYGLCERCIPLCWQPETEDSFRQLYGEKGIHYALGDGPATLVVVPPKPLTPKERFKLMTLEDRLDYIFDHLHTHAGEEL